MKRFVYSLTFAICAIAVATFVYLRSSSQSAPTFTRVESHGAHEAKAINPSSTRATNAGRERTLTAAANPKEAARSVEVTSKEVTSLDQPHGVGADEHQRISHTILDNYISGMYTDEKVKQPIPEMAAVMHHQFANEPIDQNWGPQTEQVLKDYFAGGLADVGIDLAQVGCNSTTCEVVGVLQNASNSDDQTPMDRWAVLQRGLFEQPWWKQYALGQPQSEIAFGSQDSQLVFLYLIRQNSGNP